FPDRRVALIVGGLDRHIDYTSLAVGPRTPTAPTLGLTVPHNRPPIAAPPPPTGPRPAHPPATLPALAHALPARSPLGPPPPRLPRGPLARLRPPPPPPPQSRPLRRLPRPRRPLPRRHAHLRAGPRRVAVTAVTGAARSPGGRRGACRPAGGGTAGQGVTQRH